jgi:hypothetical protein
MDKRVVEGAAVRSDFNEATIDNRAKSWRMASCTVDRTVCAKLVAGIGEPTSGSANYLGLVIRAELGDL